MIVGRVYLFKIKQVNNVLDYRIVLHPGTILFLDSDNGSMTCMGHCYLHDDNDYVEVEIS